MCLSLNSSSDRDECTQGLNRVRGSTCEQHCTRPFASPMLRLFMQHCEERTQRFRNITSKIIRNRILLLKSETEISSAVVNFKVPTIRTVGDESISRRCPIGKFSFMECGLIARRYKIKHRVSTCNRAVCYQFLAMIRSQENAS